VTFTGLQITLPFSGVHQPFGVAVDRAGDVFVGGREKNSVVELPRTPTGYGLQTTLETLGTANASLYGIAVDSAGDVFTVDQGDSLIVELPRTGTGYGPQTALPFNGLAAPQGVAVDPAGDVFVANTQSGVIADSIVELPKIPTGYGSQITLPHTGLSYPNGIAVDNAGDVFVASQGSGLVQEFPKTPTGYGPLTSLAAFGMYDGVGIAVDNAENVFVVDIDKSRVVELPKTSTGYGPQTTLPTNGLSHPRGIALDSAGDVFIADTGNNRTVEVQQPSVYVCSHGQTIPAPCSATLTLNFNIYANVTLGTPLVLTGGVPKLDFTLANGSTCTGALAENTTCTVRVIFAPLATGVRNGTVEIVDGGGNVLTTASFSGTGLTPPTGSPVARVSTTYLPFSTIPVGSTEILPLMITNVGGGTLTVATAFSGSTNYSIAGSTCGGGVTPGNSCAVLVKFSPTTIATHYGLLIVQTNGGNPTVGLKGSGSA
jgi:serine/threonine-protein kinase